MGIARRFGPLIVALVFALAPAACTQVPTSTPRPVTPIPTIPSSQPTPGGPSAGPTATPTPVGGGLAEWRQVAPQDSLRGAQINAVTHVGNQFLALGCVTNQEGCVQPAIWESEGGLEWRASAPVLLAPELSSGTVNAATISPQGTLAAGSVRQGEKILASMWLRGADGWAQIVPQAASDATVTALLAIDGRLVAVGSGAFTHFSGFRGWWSGDGTTWEEATSVQGETSGYPSDILPVEGALLAWGTACGDVCPVLPSAWWISVDGRAWQPVEAPRGLTGANITAIGRTDGGLVAFGSLGPAGEPLDPAAWVADETATNWQRVEPPPQPDATTVRYHMVVGHGSVAAGIAPPGAGREQLRGLVWLRGPAETAWRAPVEIPDVEVIALLQHPEQLNRVIVIGRTFEGLEERVVIWTGLVDWAG